MAILSEQEAARYDRQIMLAEVGKAGQERLKQARVIIAGAGGLGSASSIYLASAGVGRIRIIDCDKVAISDLNRQILYSDGDIGKRKVNLAKERLEALNPTIQVEAVGEAITENNVFELVADYNLIVDGMDNLPARYLLNRAALRRNIPLFHGAVYGFEGQATTIIPGKTLCLRCLYRETVPVSKTAVLGTTPAVIGCIQATEVVKYVVGIGELLTNRLLIYDGLSSRFREVGVKKDPECDECRY